MRKRLEIRASVHRPEGGPGDPEPYAGADSFTFVLVRVRDSDGVIGTGVTGRFLAAEVAHFLNGSVAEALPAAGDDPVRSLMRRFNPRGMTGVVISAFSALDIALVDLEAQRAGVSAATLLGGCRPSAPVHVTCGFPSLDTAALAETCATEVEAGARGVKVLVATRDRTVAEDVDRLRAVRAAIGPDADLIADANCRMDLETAAAFVRAAEGLRLAWLEEPIAGNERHGLTELARLGLVPLGAGQMEQSADRFALLGEAGVDVIQPNAVFAGGLGQAVAVAQEAIAKGHRVAPAGGWDFVNLQWMCGAIAEGAVELHRAHARIARLLCPEGHVRKEGRLLLPDAPGFAFTPDEEGLSRCRVA